MSVVEDPDLAAIARIEAVPTILRIVGNMTGLRLTLVARVTDDAWKACAVLDRMNFGLEPGGQLDVVTTLCREVRDQRRSIVMDCASEDPVYRDHQTPKLYGFQSYVSVPIYQRDGSYFGTLCGLDPRPLPLKASETVSAMELYAKLIGLQLEAEERQRTTESALTDARRTAELREQFIAVLGHDIRTPLTAILTGAGLLRDRGLAPAEARIVERMFRSATRISRLVDDVLDFARGQLGDGIPLTRAEVHDLSAVFRQVMEEARVNFPERTIEERIEAIPPMLGDRERLAQVLSNLLVNALQHSPDDAPVKVHAHGDGGMLHIEVVNHGEPIAESLMPRLFLPYSRGGRAKPSAGLGLGLYIVSQIVKSHGGSVQVQSSRDRGTTFACIVPLTSTAGGPKG